MQIKYFEVNGYKNLNSTKLEPQPGLITIIGNNGSGKSNLLEALSIIFRNLYDNKKNIPFDFIIKYTLYGESGIVEIRKEGSNLSFKVNDERKISIDNYLPKKVVAIYSGEEDRLWRECYQPFYINYISNINKQQSASLPQMLYLNKYYWNIALLCLCLSSEENEDFVEEVLNITKIDTIEFKYSKINYNNYSNNPTLNFVKLIDNKTDYSIDKLREILNVSYNQDDIFMYLYIAFAPKHTKIIDEINIMFNDGLKIEDLSEGQKKLLLIKAALEFAGQENSLFILDEPDAYVHVNNKNKIIRIFNEYKEHRQIILTTHSPTITECVSSKNLYMLNSGQFIPRTQQEIIQDITGEFWDAHSQNTFLSSNKNIILLLEGKSDVAHIKNAFMKLKDDYDDLNIDVFQCGGVQKINPFMTGLYEAEYDRNKLYIAIYDADSDGKKALNTYEKVENRKWKKLKENNHKHNNFFALELPLSNEDATIENMYDIVKYKNAYQKAVLKYIPNLSTEKSIKKISTEITESSKKILAEDSLSFAKEDLENFKNLFNIIREINEYYHKFEGNNENNNNAANSTNSAIEINVANTKVTIDELTPNIPKVTIDELTPNIPKVTIDELTPNIPKVTIDELTPNIPKATIDELTPNIPKVTIDELTPNIPKVTIDNSNAFNDKEDVIFSLKRVDADAKAKYNFGTKKITILSGSKIKLKEISSFSRYYPKEKKERDKILSTTKTTRTNKNIILNEDIEFENLRGAILFCTTTNLNSSTSWIAPNRKTLAQYIEETGTKG
jgi:predicted ATP-dependent endonuclease of OLD family